MRASGILMHITSLPGPYGVGTLGKESYKFVDFLQSAGQRYWQVLPLTPTGYGDSPYQSCSAYAGNHYLIDLDLLVEEGLLEKEEITACNWGEDDSRVDFGLQYTHKLSVLRLAYGRFADRSLLNRFAQENAFWLSDYALYMALKETYDGKPWYQWPQDLKLRKPDAIWQARRDLKDRIDFYCFVQYVFAAQWEALHRYARSRGIGIIGDVPIYVPYDSVEVWSNPEWFCLDEDLTPTAVAGCPPDAFSEDGQLWGNPLYCWERHKADGYTWWLQRLQAAANRYDVIRIDHFRGFAGYYAIAYGAENAKGGKWLPGPGMDFIRAVQNRLPSTPMIAEDLGYLTEDVHKLRQDAGYPGMKVLEFAFDGDADNLYLPHNHERNTVCYTGTHDNMPIGQWLAESGEKTIGFAKTYMGDPQDALWGMIRMCMSSVADLAIVQMQDYLGLGGEARMNFPGTQTGNNWTWRASPGFTGNGLAEKIYSLTGTYGRLWQ